MVKVLLRVINQAENSHCAIQMHDCFSNNFPGPGCPCKSMNLFSSFLSHVPEKHYWEIGIIEIRKYHISHCWCDWVAFRDSGVPHSALKSIVDCKIEANELPETEKCLMQRKWNKYLYECSLIVSFDQYYPLWPSSPSASANCPTR